MPRLRLSCMDAAAAVALASCLACLTPAVVTAFNAPAPFLPATMRSGAFRRASAPSRLALAPRPLSRPRARDPRPAALRCSAERLFQVGAAVEAQWIGDDGWYPGVVDGHLKDNKYDVRWADPQGLADTQVTEQENIRTMNPSAYYRYGLGALEQGDVATAWLAFRAVWICVGKFADTEKYVKMLEETEQIKQLVSARRDLDFLMGADGAAPVKPGSMVSDAGSKPIEEQNEDNMYSESELDDLRQQAMEDSGKKAMWAQDKAFQDAHCGDWYGVWEDYAYEEGGLGAPKERKQIASYAPTSREDGRPCMIRTVADADGKVLEEVRSDFYPASMTSWFVGNCFTFAKLKDETHLELEVGVRHADYRTRSAFTYVRGTQGEWGLTKVSLGREQLRSFPEGGEECLYRKTGGGGEAPQVFTGPADRLSTAVMRKGGNVMQLQAAGGITVECPTSIPEEEELVTQKQVCIRWSCPSTPGVAWDGADRIIPALEYTCSRVFRQPTEELTMLSVFESVPQ